jgi:hypothetical protein
VKGYLKVNERDRHRWLDGMRDIREHDLEIGDRTHNVSPLEHSPVYFFPKSPTYIVSLRFFRRCCGIEVMVMLIVRIKT